MSIPTAFFTWELLATLAGAAAAVFLVVQFTKDFLPATIPVRLYAWVWGWAILTLAAVATGAFTWSVAALNILNGGVVAFTAMGGFEVLKTAGVAKSRSD